MAGGNFGNSAAAFDQFDMGGGTGGGTGAGVSAAAADMNNQFDNFGFKDTGAAAGGFDAVNFGGAAQAQEFGFDQFDMGKGNQKPNPAPADPAG